MENLYPLFERNRILKKELLWSLRDYSFGHLQEEYRNYADGILRGCQVRVDGRELAVSSGMVKHRGFLYLISGEMRIGYKPTEQMEVLKLRLEEDRRSEDYILYRITLFLDRHREKKEGELEVCRFKLRHGSVLRDRYKDFQDMATEFDTIQVVEADFAGPEGRSLPVAVTDYFARLVLTENSSRPEDISFAYLCLNRDTPVRREILEHYVASRSGHGRDRERKRSRRELFEGLVRILEDIRGSRSIRVEGTAGKRQILVD
ncbi:MAG: hypothetical protein MR430_00935 [Lachnospiraceae bacterium]|nr:hypothetical protein [Lachnospiraceae bacterium]